MVDFIRHNAAPGAIRFKPILLTALAATIGATTILFDPIFQGAGDFAAVWVGVLDVVDGAGYSSNRCGDEG